MLSQFGDFYVSLNMSHLNRKAACGYAKMHTRKTHDRLKMTLRNR